MRPPTQKTRNKTATRVAFSKSTQQVLPTHPHILLQGVVRVWGGGKREIILLNPLKSHSLKITSGPVKRSQDHRRIIPEHPIYLFCDLSESSFANEIIDYVFNYK